MRLVIDASVIIKWFVNNPLIEENTEQALEILQLIKVGRISVVQPIHWKIEVIAVLCRLHSQTINEYIALLDILQFDVKDNSMVNQQAAKLAEQHQHHLFDTLYHAVAIEESVMLVTADKKYFNKVSDKQDSIVLLSQWKSDSPNSF